MDRRWPTADWLLAMTLAIGLSTVVGCQRASDKGNEPDAVVPPPVVFSPSAVSEAAAVDIDLEVVDLDGYTKVLERRHGKVVLVDFWATWCIPCVKHFPDVVRWSRAYADQGLAVIAVSVDDSGSEPAVVKFLEKQGAQFDTLLSEMGTGSDTWEAFDIPGGVPFYKLYDRTGHLRYRFSGNADIADTEPLEKIEPRIKELIAEQ